MILDSQTLMSNNQAITASAASTDYIDLGAVGTPTNGNALVRDIGLGVDIPFFFQVTETFNTLTSLTIALQTDDNTSFSSATTVYTETIALASLVKGARLAIDTIPRNTKERYVRMNYTVTGSNPTLGKVTAGVALATDDR